MDKYIINPKGVISSNVVWNPLNTYYFSNQLLFLLQTPFALSLGTRTRTRFVVVCVRQNMILKDFQDLKRYPQQKGSILQSKGY